MSVWKAVWNIYSLYWGAPKSQPRVQSMSMSGYNPNPFRTLHILADNLRTLQPPAILDIFSGGTSISLQQAVHLFRRLF